jgi:hypothetical protein
VQRPSQLHFSLKVRTAHLREALLHYRSRIAQLGFERRADR